ncbi:hypothetical protein BGX26_009229 [Mortierella sp. AD094]|nr:hypothetical protein BGX26_009229 [Mortierella sp. AD094]
MVVFVDRVPVYMVDHGMEENIQEHIQETIDRFTSVETSADSGDEVVWSAFRDEPVSRIRQQQLPGVISASTRRSAKIDAERVAVRRGPSGVSFVSRVGLGTPPQYFRLAFDISSGDIWVAMEGANCTEPEPCSAKRRYYNPSRSSTFETWPDISWRIGFSDNSRAKGKLNTDILQAGGFVIDRQVVGIASVLVGFKENLIDGTFGLALKNLAYHGDATPIENLIATKGMKSEVGIWLGAGKQGGELAFGDHDPARFKGELMYFSLPEKAVYWSLPVMSIGVSQPAPLPSAGSKSADIESQTPTTTSSDSSISNASSDSTTSSTTTTTTTSTPTATPSMQINAMNGPNSKQPNIIFDTSSNLILVPPRIAAGIHRYIHNFLFGYYSGYSIFAGAYTVSCNLNTDVWVELGPSIESTLGNNVNTTDSPTVSPPKRFKIAAQDIR